jgi:hypothetical protein
LSRDTEVGIASRLKESFKRAADVPSGTKKKNHKTIGKNAGGEQLEATCRTKAARNRPTV